MKGYLKKLGHIIFLGINYVLESQGRIYSGTPIGYMLGSDHWGLGWEYYTQKIPIYNTYYEEYDRHGVTVQFRKSKYTGRHERRTMLPIMNGMDDNRWVYYDGEPMEFKKH